MFAHSEQRTATSMVSSPQTISTSTFSSAPATSRNLRFSPPWIPPITTATNPIFAAPTAPRNPSPTALLPSSRELPQVPLGDSASIRPPSPRRPRRRTATQWRRHRYWTRWIWRRGRSNRCWRRKSRRQQQPRRLQQQPRPRQLRRRRRFERTGFRRTRPCQSAALAASNPCRSPQSSQVSASRPHRRRGPATTWKPTAAELEILLRSSAPTPSPATSRGCHQVPSQRGPSIVSRCTTSLRPTSRRGMTRSGPRTSTVQPHSTRPRTSPSSRPCRLTSSATSRPPGATSWLSWSACPWARSSQTTCSASVPTRTCTLACTPS
mmetsp:Transcript_8298/g.17796  ORF Transcript_8298/g.17796 Transcript_8298/m.17796 type:complete len:322 (+) Transcript_8298:281-1246(+)